VLGLGRWGAMTMDLKHPEEIVTANSLIIGLRATFRPEAARGLWIGYELQISDVTLHVKIDDGLLEALPGPLPGADMTIEPGLMLKALISGDVTPAQALASGDVRVTGEPALLDRFVEVFKLGDMPAPETDIWHRHAVTP
jgi:alkyl sulfatase BDS1-like metallo-beta-lactamase superfamily hydrolase